MKVVSFYISSDLFDESNSGFLSRAFRLLKSAKLLFDFYSILCFETLVEALFLTSV